MMLPGKGRIWFTLALAIFIGVFIAMAVTYPAKARLIPLIIGVPTLALVMLILLEERFPMLLRLFDTSITDLMISGDFLQETSSKDENGAGAEAAKVLKTTVWMAGLFLALYLVGWLITVFVFTFAFGWLFAGVRWWQALLVAVGVEGFVWGIMGEVMGLRLFEGVLRGGLMPPF